MFAAADGTAFLELKGQLFKLGEPCIVVEKFAGERNLETKEIFDYLGGLN